MEHTSMYQNSSNRKTNFELLRIICMLMIIGLHFNNFSGCLDNFKNTSLNYFLCWGTESFCYNGVNIFILLSGYFGYKRPINKCRVSVLVSKTMLYSWMFTLIGIIFVFIKIDIDWSVSYVIRGLTPIISGDYWFITSYLMMLSFSPIMNNAINKFHKEKMIMLLIALVSVFSVIPTFMPWCDINIFNYGEGSPIWFCVLYLTGGYISKYVSFDGLSRSELYHIRMWAILIVFALLAVVTFSKFSISFLSKYFLGKELGSGVLYHHNSLFIYGCSISILLLFKTLNIRYVTINSIVTNIAPSVFSIYLIHDNIIAKQFIWRFVRSLEDYNSPFWILFFIGSTLGIFGTSLLLDRIINKIVPIQYLSNVLLNICNIIFIKVNKMLAYSYFVRSAK